MYKKEHLKKARQSYGGAYAIKGHLNKKNLFLNGI